MVFLQGIWDHLFALIFFSRLRKVFNRPFQCTIRSHGAKWHMLVCKLRSGSSETKVSALFWNMLEVPLCNLFISMCHFVPCDRIVQRAYSKCVLKLIEWFQNGALYHTKLPVNKRLYHISDGHARPLHAPSIKMEIWKCLTNKMIKGNQFLKKLSSFRKREIFAYSQVKISEVSTLHSPFGTHKWREQLNG